MGEKVNLVEKSKIDYILEDDEYVISNERIDNNQFLRYLIKSSILVCLALFAVGALMLYFGNAIKDDVIISDSFIPILIGIVLIPYMIFIAKRSKANYLLTNKKLSFVDPKTITTLTYDRVLQIDYSKKKGIIKVTSTYYPKRYVVNVFVGDKSEEFYNLLKTNIKNASFHEK